MKNTTQLVNLLQQAIQQNSTLIGQLQSILKNMPESHEVSILKTRGMDSMQMIESILEHPKIQHNTLNFISGLREHLEIRGQLSESQRFHLETTFQNMFGD